MNLMFLLEVSILFKMFICNQKKFKTLLWPTPPLLCSGLMHHDGVPFIAREFPLSRAYNVCK